VADSYGLEEHNKLHFHKVEKLKMQAAVTKPNLTYQKSMACRSMGLLAYFPYFEE
jgi:hypothetical protein